LGSIFEGNIPPKKMYPQRVLLRHITSPFKGTCFLIKKKEAKVALYGPYLHC
jgi:hypothetical protein